MKIHDYLSPEELKRLASALLVVLGFIAIAAFFGFTVVPGLRYQAYDAGEVQVKAVQGETGWLDPTNYPAMPREVIPPIDPKTVMTPNPALMTRGRAIFAQTNRVMGINKDRTYLHQGSHTQRISSIFREHQECRAEWNKTAM